MSLNLDDPLVAQQLLGAIDRRIDAALARRLPRRAYGVVASVNATAKTASVYVSGSASASPDFRWAEFTPPAPGSRVRVVVNGGDRYIEEVYGLAGEEGSSFPTAIAGRRFFRTDLNREYVFNATFGEWMSTQLLFAQAGRDETSVASWGGTATGSVGRILPPSAPFAIAIEKFVAVYRVVTTNDAANHYGITLRRFDLNGTAHTVTAPNTASAAPGAWTFREVTLTLTNHRPGQEVMFYDVILTKAGAPGAINVIPGIMYREVAR